MAAVMEKRACSSGFPSLQALGCANGLTIQPLRAGRVARVAEIFLLGRKSGPGFSRDRFPLERQGSKRWIDGIGWGVQDASQAGLNA